MSGSIRVEQIRYVTSRSEQAELRRMIRLEQSGVKASGEGTRQIRADQEHHVEREELFQNRREKFSKNIRVESERSSVDHIGESSVVQNDAEQVEDPI